MNVKTKTYPNQNHDPNYNSYCVGQFPCVDECHNSILTMNLTLTLTSTLLHRSVVLCGRQSGRGPDQPGQHRGAADRGRGRQSHLVSEIHTYTHLPIRHAPSVYTTSYNSPTHPRRRSVYIVKQVSVRTRLLVIFDFFKNSLFGRDMTSL